jgi:hypothetical protein
MDRIRVSLPWCFLKLLLWIYLKMLHDFEELRSNITVLSRIFYWISKSCPQLLKQPRRVRQKTVRYFICVGRQDMNWRLVWQIAVTVKVVLYIPASFSQIPIREQQHHTLEDSANNGWPVFAYLIFLIRENLFKLGLCNDMIRRCIYSAYNDMVVANDKFKKTNYSGLFQNSPGG